MINDFISLYVPSYPKVVVYMLQNSEYQIRPYLTWYWRTKNFKQVMKRRQLDPTRSAKLLLLVMQVGSLTQIILGLYVVYLGIWQSVVGATTFGAAIILSYPLVWAHLIVLPLLAGRLLVVKPAERRLAVQSERIFSNHKGLKIAIVGSYGKTTMKELLNTVLGQSKNVVATPANKNVSTSHAVFARDLTGDEEILIIEYGEGAPGDVAGFAATTHPTHAVITGLAPAHLDQYKTLAAAGEDIFSVADYLDGKQVYVNADSPAAKPFIKSGFHKFGVSGALGWKADNIETGLDGTSFTLKKSGKKLKFTSHLVGKHQVGYLAFVAAFALELGLSEKQVQHGIAETKPFEHRMQPYKLSGATIIDDTYNGNLEGIRAGTELLQELKAKRKIYVTPGLVDQGEESERVHSEMGELIAAAKPNMVVLMKNSVTDYIQKGLEGANYKGELLIESDPLGFYSNLKHFVAVGDLVVMQNDWPDNYK